MLGDRSLNQRKRIEQYSYGLKDQIGKGFSSVVFRGRNENTGETVAVKVIDLKRIKDEVGKTMLHSEIQILKALRHPNILCCYDVYSTINNCYIITEYCEDGDLASLLKLKRRLPENDALKLFKDIYSGFREMATRGYLHRDLKPANIFLSKGVAKIADFGFARIAGNPSERQKYNVGTPLYMSPQSLKKNVYSVKNDIWSLGIILYELLNGQTPWESRSEKELVDKMMRIPPVVKVPVAEQVRDLIKQCLTVEEVSRIGLKELQNHVLIQQLEQKFAHDTFVRRSPLLVENPRTKSPGAQGSSKERQAQKAPPPPPKDQKPNSIKVNITQITTQINFCRFIFKLSQQVKSMEGAPPLQETLIPRVNRLKSLMEGEDNYMRLLDWDNFVRWEGYAKYRLVVQEYWTKYTKVFGEASPEIEHKQLVAKIQKFVKLHVEQLSSQLRSRPIGEKLSDEQQGTAVAVDFMLTLLQLVCLESDHFEDFQFFSRHSKIELIVEAKPNRLQVEHWNMICTKASLLDCL